MMVTRFRVVGGCNVEGCVGHVGLRFSALNPKP